MDTYAVICVFLELLKMRRDYNNDNLSNFKIGSVHTPKLRVKTIEFNYYPLRLLVIYFNKIKSNKLIFLSI